MPHRLNIIRINAGFKRLCIIDSSKALSCKIYIQVVQMISRMILKMKKMKLKITKMRKRMRKKTEMKNSSNKKW